MKKSKLGLDLLFPVLVAAVFSLLTFSAVYRGAERKVYDLLLHLRPAVTERPELLFLDIDDNAIAQVGQFPWSRDIMADGLIVMREFGADRAVFDIEYTEASPRGVNAELLRQQIPELFTTEFAGINQRVRDLIRALQTGTISMRDAGDYVQDLVGLTDASKQILLAKVQEISRDNDDYLGKATRLFQKAFFTVSMLDAEEPTIPQAVRQYALEHVAVENASEAEGLRIPASLRAADIRAAILPILGNARGAGFPNIVVDDDGVLRRIALLRQYRGRYFAQLGFAPLLDMLGSPALELEQHRLVLRGAVMPGGGKKDIVIPLSREPKQEWTMLIDWPRESYAESYQHLSFYNLVLHKRLEADLLYNLGLMEEAGYLSTFKGDYGLLDPYRYADSLLQEVLGGGDPGLMEEYRQVRQTFFRDVGEFLNGDAEQELLGRLEVILASPEVSEQDKAAYREVQASLPGVFGATRQLYQELSRVRATLGEYLPGAFCFIGWTGTSTTDIGVNPFQSEYMNVGTHASVVNTILSGRFLRELPWWYGAVLAFGFSVGVAFLIRRLSPLPSILVGVGVLLLVVAGLSAFFVFTGLYLSVLTPGLSVFFSVFLIILFKFLLLEKEKSFLRDAFSHYLSNDVISELISDPNKLNLGGAKKHLTAMFTDVRGFSTISEQLDPTELVKLLNAYLTEMSNIILELKGTIDKYEGDAIIAFFGAPVVFGDHAVRACRAAVLMKKMEQHVNEHFLREKLSPVPLLTRVGINTGEMVVGNMGTARKMDYTIMGNSVNLASRLEGVNKQYGTWVLISEDTRREIGEQFILRQMDRVRVVGIEQPVRLYELVDEKGAGDAATLEAIEVFHRGQQLFEAKRWEEALAQFRKVLKILPGDGPATAFSKRCQEFKRKPPLESWDGVFNLTMK
jgi:adenylate cyclase